MVNDNVEKVYAREVKIVQVFHVASVVSYPIINVYKPGKLKIESRSSLHSKIHGRVF